jgi:hypothetical protein
MGLFALLGYQGYITHNLVTMACNLLWGKHNIKALLALGIKDLLICFVRKVMPFKRTSVL